MDLTLVARQLLLFAHIVAFAIAFAAVAREDWRLIQPGPIDRASLQATATVVKWGLIALWLTGLAMVYVEIGFDASELLNRPKLLSKIVVVTALTGNGALLNFVAFPCLSRGTDRLRSAAMMCSLLGAFSTVSWIYAAFVGSARLIAPQMTVTAFLGAYGVALALGMAVAAALVAPMVERRLAGHPGRTDYRTEAGSGLADQNVAEERAIIEGASPDSTADRRVSTSTVLPAIDNGIKRVRPWPGISVSGQESAALHWRRSGL